ncbi:YpfB family protein [Aquibacillus sp. 3ASR75-11]|uniref:YpfB family protein n=1 Tax=Terrihalobacillus insolitus TaxID=2950438 RepID=A0A9X4AM14_9BACI|nr:DUF5359 family protein [Terrihalobacillus insolitus]MDC3413069.1 YpfB family protein [Terrihalobacillus insolitus]MDC3424811.1 YpfB family protein [Terrihalobacillus insolitus]
MKRMEKWIITLVLSHFILLIVTQVLINHTDFEMQWNPVFEYLGVNQIGNSEIRKTIDLILNNVLSF